MTKELELPPMSFRARKGKLSEWTDSLVDPNEPTVAEPGTSEKVVTLAARYEAGLPLWNEDDRDTHQPMCEDGLDGF